MSQLNSFDPQGLCPPSVTFPHNFGKLFLKKHAKINSKKNKASSFEQYSSFYFASPQTKPWSLMTPSLNKSTFFRVNLIRMSNMPPSFLGTFV